ncbi:hypothetical protein ACEYXF_30735 [Streptomyces asiaticus]|uniref:hypothetical protein n=1 Tax=Streptomyces asiaticus TaxID=114695 RepID=UPI0039BDE9A7
MSHNPIPSPISSASNVEQAIMWLADVPLFIDERQVSAFYDAVVRPEFENGSVTLNYRIGESQKRAVGGEVGSEVGLGFLSYLPGIKVNAKAKYDKSGEVAQQQEGSIELSPINNPHRQLIHLMLHYESNLPGRWKYVSDIRERGWRTDEFILTPPRALVFLELDDETPIIPTALESGDGSVKVVCRELEGHSTPKYPESIPNKNRAELINERRNYWKSFMDAYSDIHAVGAIERCASGGQGIRWIDFRIPISEEGDTLHIHAQPRGSYDTGTFAYSLINRGFSNGLRLVGTLKKGPSLSILGIFEK